MLKTEIIDIFSKYENLLSNFSKEFDIPGISLTTSIEKMTTWKMFCCGWFSRNYEMRGWQMRLETLYLSPLPSAGRFLCNIVRQQTEDCFYIILTLIQFPLFLYYFITTFETKIYLKLLIWVLGYRGYASDQIYIVIKFKW